MAVRARLNAPTRKPEAFPWHRADWTAVPSAGLFGGERRLEAECYLKSGTGVRLAIEANTGAWFRFGDRAGVWQPSRLKGIQVSPRFGTPFLAAGQLFDVRPTTRKWLALEKTSSAEDRFVSRGTLLVSCSGNVGRATVARKLHERTLITHDLLRLRCSADEAGWLYAFLRSSNGRSMMSAAKYGHIIKHLEPMHVEALPVPSPSDEDAAFCRRTLERIIELRDDAYLLTLDAEMRFQDALGLPPAVEAGESGFSVRASETVFGGRRRFDALPYNPTAAAMRAHVKSRTITSTLTDLGFTVWLPTRFKRIPADQGVELLNSSAPFEVNPDAGRRIAEVNFGDPYAARVEPGWLLIARSGQVYGLNGSVAFATKAHVGRVLSDDLIRIAPGPNTTIRTGYVFVALSHPVLGRPLVKSLPYGSSIPHLDVSDVQEYAIPRLSKGDENVIGELADRAAACWGEADVLEQRMGERCDRAIEALLHPPVRSRKHRRSAPR